MKKLPKKSQDIFELSILDKYTSRPEILENLCLADFATNYEFEETGPTEMSALNGSYYARKRKKTKILRCRDYKYAADKENYYREHIMLYTNWRDETSEILNQNFQSVYEQNKSVIEQNRLKYNRLDIEFELLDDSDDDDEKTCEFDEEIEQNELDFDENELRADIGRDMNEYVGKDFDIFKIQNRLPDKQYNELVRKANSRQFHFLKHIMNKSFLTNEQFHYFISGPAGCGKSFLINLITESLERLYETRGSDPSSVKILKLAPTGKAAYNINGLTLHSAFGLPTKISNNPLDLSASSLNDYYSKFIDLKLIIIDEISMVGFKVFQLVDQRLKQIMNVKKPFGGLNVIIFGDFRQLPPVGDCSVYNIPKSLGMNQLAGNVLWDLFNFYELTEVMRQKDDLAFAQCLNNLANGNMTNENINLIRSRTVDNLNEIPQSAINLFYSNKEVDEYNAKKILSLNTEGCVVKANDNVFGKGPKQFKTSLLRKAKKMNRKDTANLSYEIHLKISAKYMLIYNTRTSDGLVNGAMGILRHIECCKIKNSKKIGVKRIWLEFDEEKIGKETRRESISYMIKNKLNPRYTPINRLGKQILANKHDGLSIHRSQFPIQVAESITIHKSQGATYDKCAVNLQPGMRRSMMYVAFSRATKADGLNIIGKFEPPKPPSDDDPISKEMKRLRTYPVIPTYEFLHQRGDYAGIQFMYHNVQSLPKHFDDMLADPCFLQSDLILLAETWTIPSDYFEIPGFDMIARIDGNRKTRKPSGVMVYAKESLQINSVKMNNTNNCGVQIITVYVQDNIRFVVLYANPRISTDEKLDAIFQALEDDEDCKTVLVGDFNINFDSPEGDLFARELEIMGLKLRTNPKHYTTLGRTTIDAIFSNQSMRTDVYMSTYSYHMALYGRIQ